MGRRTLRRIPGSKARARRLPPRWAADNGRWGSGDWPSGRTSAEGCSTAPFPCRRCCGCRARRAAGAAPARRGRTAPRLPAPVRPASCAAGYRWTGILDSAGSLRHTVRPAPARTSRSRRPRQCPRSGSAVRLHRRFSNYGPARRESEYDRSSVSPMPFSAVMVRRFRAVPSL